MICPEFLPEFPWSFFSRQDPSGSSRRKIAAQRPLDFSQTIYHLNWGFPHVFFIAYFILSVSISSVKIVSISADSDFPPLRNYIFKRRNLFIKYVSKYKNRLYTSKYNWKDLKELFPSETLRPLRDDDFTEDLTQGEKFFGIFYNIFRGNSGKNFNFHFNSIIFIHVWLNYCEKAINTSKQSFHIRSFIVSYNVCPVAIPETCAKTQRSDYWQLIHCFCVCICAGIRLLLLGTGKSKHERYANL